MENNRQLVMIESMPTRRRRSKITPAEQRTMRRLHSTGHSFTEIAVRFNCTRDTVSKYCGRSYKVGCTPKNRDELRGKAFLLLDKGKDKQEIADILGIAYTTVWKWDKERERLGQKPESLKVEASKVEIPQAADAQTPTTLKVVTSRQTLRGQFCEYTVDTEKGNVVIFGGPLAGELDKSMLDRLMTELAEVRKSMEAERDGLL